MNRRWVSAAAACLISGCAAGSQTDKKIAQAAQVPVDELQSSVQVDWAHKPQADEWTTIALAAIADIGTGLVETVPADIDEFCPAYESLDSAGRSAFWVGLLSAMARYESDFDPAVSFNERAHCSRCSWAVTQDGRDVISRGLLQLSQESANGYPGCTVPAADEERLHEPELNLRCGVAIMARLVSRDRVIGAKRSKWRGGAAYWSVLRSGKRKEIRAFTSKTARCSG